MFTRWPHGPGMPSQPSRPWFGYHHNVDDHTQHPPGTRNSPSQRCRRYYNEGKCQNSASSFRYLHKCMECGGLHPCSQCPAAGKETTHVRGHRQVNTANLNYRGTCQFPRSHATAIRGNPISPSINRTMCMMMTTVVCQALIGCIYVWYHCSPRHHIVYGWRGKGRG